MNFFNLWFYILLIIIIEGKNGQTKDNINISIKNELKNEIICFKSNILKISLISIKILKN